MTKKQPKIDENWMKIEMAGKKQKLDLHRVQILEPARGRLLGLQEAG